MASYMDAIVDISLKVIMKSQKQTLLIFSVMLLLMIGSCTQPIVFPAETSIATINLNDTLTPVLSSVSSPVATFNSASTSVPVLSAQDASELMLTLLSNNGNCYLPCLWGITPGESSMNEAVRILEPLANISNFTRFESERGTINPVYIDENIGIYLNIGYSADKGGIVSITFNAKALREISQGNYEKLYGDPLYDKLLIKYSLLQILTEYGIPYSILIRTNSEPPPQFSGSFEFLLLYPQQGILVHYTTIMEPMGLNIKGCPTKSEIELYLVPFGILSSTNELLQSHVDSSYRPLEEVTSLSVNNFFNIFSQPTNTCIETPAKYWPPP